MSKLKHPTWRRFAMFNYGILASLLASCASKPHPPVIVPYRGPHQETSTWANQSIGNLRTDPLRPRNPAMASDADVPGISSPADGSTAEPWTNWPRHGGPTSGKASRSSKPAEAESADQAGPSLWDRLKELVASKGTYPTPRPGTPTAGVKTGNVPAEERTKRADAKPGRERPASSRLESPPVFRAALPRNTRQMTNAARPSSAPPEVSGAPVSLSAPRSETTPGRPAEPDAAGAPPSFQTHRAGTSVDNHTLTSLADLAATTNLITAVGRVVRLTAVPIHEVFGDQFFSVRTAEGTEFFVWTVASLRDFRPGDGVDLLGRLKGVPEGVDQLGLDTNLAAALQAQPVYIFAPEVKKSGTP